MIDTLITHVNVINKTQLLNPDYSIKNKQKKTTPKYITTRNITYNALLMSFTMSLKMSKIAIMKTA